MSIHFVAVPFLGRRWKARCDRCGVDLPGRYADKRDALNAADVHELERHTRETV